MFECHSQQYKYPHRFSVLGHVQPGEFCATLVGHINRNGFVMKNVILKSLLSYKS